jgi:hypothetical protein
MCCFGFLKYHHGDGVVTMEMAKPMLLLLLLSLQVWVVPELRDDGKIYWTADSDSQLTKGLAALLVLGLSGCSPAEILSVRPGFIEMLGLKQSLTPSRNNGFLNMFLKMQKLTLGLVVSWRSKCICSWLDVCRRGC